LPNLSQIEHDGGTPDVSHDRHSAETGDDLAQQLKSLCTEIGLLERQAHDIAAGSRETSTETGGTGVATSFAARTSRS
jgi:phage host-nuclease inhibitor protein Gam